MPGQYRFALGTRLGEQAIIIAPLPDLQQLPAENLRQGLARELALQRVHPLAERRAQPGVQVEGGRFGHNAEDSGSIATAGLQSSSERKRDGRRNFHRHACRPGTVRDQLRYPLAARRHGMFNTRR
jgi:hypothetical protein